MKKTFSKGTINIDETMPTDYEIALNKFMPAFKAKAASILVTRNNISQQEAATLLGLSQAAISKYINGIYSKSVEGSMGRLDRIYVES